MVSTTANSCNCKFYNTKNKQKILSNTKMTFLNLEAARHWPKLCIALFSNLDTLLNNLLPVVKNFVQKSSMLMSFIVTDCEHEYLDRLKLGMQI